MVKKTFKDNPAMQFISEQKPATEQNKLEEKTVTMGLPTYVQAPEGYKLNPIYVETKSKRAQFVFQPSVYARVKEAAKREGLSVNEYVHRTLDNATRFLLEGE